MRNAIAIVSGVITVIIFAVLMIMILGFVVEVLWNTTIPDVFGLPEITYWQAVRLFLLAYLFIGGGTVVSTVVHKGGE